MRQRRQGHGKTLVGSHGSGDGGMMVDGGDSVRREKVLCGKRAVKYTSGKTIFPV